MRAHLRDRGRGLAVGAGRVAAPDERRRGGRDLRRRRKRDGRMPRRRRTGDLWVARGTRVRQAYNTPERPSGPVGGGRRPAN